MARENHKRISFLRNLLRDRTANTIAISAAAMLPLLAIVGSGVDASRYYMTQSRMQAACDAGALAARRVMTTDEFTDEARDTGLDFYDQNFTQGMFGLEEGVREYTSDGEGTVLGTASGTLPTSLMSFFGFGSFPLSVSCSAEINISNTDIMFVLDVTGSMAECPDGSSSCGGGPGSKIFALREAVLNFYDTVEDATSDSAQVRYGVVPYSQQVNVGMSIPREHMANVHTYQSRVARFEEVFIPGNGIEVGEEIVQSDQWEWLPRSLSNFGSSNSGHYRFRQSGTSARVAAQNFCWNTLPGTYTVNGWTWEVFPGTQYYTDVWSSGNTNSRAGCAGRVRKSKIATEDDVIEDRYEYPFKDYIYCPVDTDDATPCGVTNPAGSPQGWESVDLRTLYDDNRILMPTGHQGAMEELTWQGCIEEPSTVLTDNYSPLPANAFDLQINLVPASEEQRWKPALRDAVYKREDGTSPGSGSNTMTWLEQTENENHPSWVCPPAAIRLSEIERANLQNYLDNLTPSGQTYHDIGMLWGARFITPRGIFAADNSAAPNGDAIARHIVFMTDGVQVNSVENYSIHGVEWWDRRISGDGNSGREFSRRASRLQAICRAARQENITVWVVAFGVNLTQNLIDCASPGRAFQANDAETLNDRFQEIAQKIAALRLTS